MKAKFLYKEEYSVIGTLEPALCGIEVNGRKVPFTGAREQVENFGITAEEMAVFVGNAESVHFEREIVCLPVRGTGLNEKTRTEEILVLTVSAIANREVIKAAQMSRVLSRW